MTGLDTRAFAEHCAEALRRYDCPSVSIAVAERGEVVFAEAYGTADTATGRPATPGTAYGLASVTKPFTAAAVCAAADDGLLDLDAPVPGTFRFGAPTLRQLLRHRGGLAPFYHWEYDGDGGRPIDPDAYVLQLRAPDAGFEYANLGYRLLGRELEAAAGVGLAEFVRRRVCEPLGLDACRIGARYTGPAPAAVRYAVDGRAYPDYDCGHPGATLGWATAGELALFTGSFGRVMGPGTAAATLAGLPVNEHLGYGLGWCVAAAGAGSPLVHSHGGGGPGVAAMTIGVPGRGLAVSVLTNTTNKGARDAIVRHVMAELVPGYRDEWISPVVPDPARPLALPEGSTWAGAVNTPEREVPLVVRILTEGQVEVRLGGEGVVAPAAGSDAWDLKVSVPVRLPTGDAGVGSPVSALLLRAGGDGLSGVLYAYKEGDAVGRLGNFLAHACGLRRR
ncbi:serine hydrolase domain-containing protein [Streptomyces sp. CA-111067]|uniref:serine hydrolase domain-containing protein n=1 Tax=Streptomyces sp. CA-111067 TaxID=3240046 RepID=UPI003D97B6B7